MCPCIISPSYVTRWTASHHYPAHMQHQLLPYVYYPCWLTLPQRNHSQSVRSLCSGTLRQTHLARTLAISAGFHYCSHNPFKSEHVIRRLFDKYPFSHILSHGIIVYLVCANVVFVKHFESIDLIMIIFIAKYRNSDIMNLLELDGVGCRHVSCWIGRLRRIRQRSRTVIIFYLDFQIAFSSHQSPCPDISVNRDYCSVRPRVERSTGAQGDNH